jgi:hypothetical protein
MKSRIRIPLTLLVAGLLAACATPREEGSREPSVGEAAPPLVLPLANGGEFSLDQATAEKKVIVVFYRGRF